MSHYQGDIDWKKVKQSGVEFAIAKCSQGTSFLDSKYYQNKVGALSTGILFGSYHFADGGDPKKEADYFVKNVGQMADYEILVLDWEIQHADPVGWCKKWLARVNELVGFRPLIYINASTSKQFDWSPISKDNGLWVAQYGVNNGQMNGKPDIGSSFPWWVIWQYTSRGAVPGIAGNVDLNTLSGDMDMLRKYGKKPDECNHQCPKHCR